MKVIIILFVCGILLNLNCIDTRYYRKSNRYAKGVILFTLFIPFFYVIFNILYVSFVGLCLLFAYIYRTYCSIKREKDER